MRTIERFKRDAIAFAFAFLVFARGDNFLEQKKEKIDAERIQRETNRKETHVKEIF